jgi:hypothetical protein
MAFLITFVNNSLKSFSMLGMCAINFCRMRSTEED